MDRNDLSDSFYAIHCRYDFDGARSSLNLHKRELKIEIFAHELAHVIEIGPSPNFTPEIGSSKHVHDYLLPLPAKERDQHEFRTLAIEVLGLRRLGYQIRVRTLARRTELSTRPKAWKYPAPNSPWITRYIERAVTKAMEQDDVRKLADVFVHEVESCSKIETVEVP